MRPIKLKESIKHAIKHNLPLLIKGAPGVGKTDIMKQACEETDTELIISHPVVSDPTDYKGLPFPNPDGKEAHFLPFGELNKLLQADKPTVFFMDDLGQASISVQAACFPKNTPVNTRTGVKDIQDIKVGDWIIDGDGRPQKVTETFERESENMITISAVGILPIKCTREHPILVSKGRKRIYKQNEEGTYDVERIDYPEPEWKQAYEIEPGEWIGLPVPKPYRTDTELVIACHGQTTRTVKLTKEFAELCGMFAGDGWFTQHKNVQSIGFAMDSKYPEIIDRLAVLIETVMGTTPSFKMYRSHERIQFHDKDMGEFLSKHIGTRSYNKRIPEWILYHENLDLLTAFLKGYLYTDGSLLRSSGVTRGVQWSSVSRTLMLQVQQALLRYGTVASIKFRCRKGDVMISPRDGKEYNVRDSYLIQCSDKRVLDALESPYDDKRDVCWSYEYNGLVWTRVKDVIETKEPSQKVYNIEVENSHTYTVNNVCVHNCMQLILGRQINGFNVSDHVVFMAATNRRQDKAGVAGILEPVKSRFASIIELTPTHEDWIQWALKEGVNERVIAFVKTKPDILFAFEATSDLVNTPSPRTIVNASKIIDTIKDDLILRDELVAGAAGEGFAAEYAAYERVYDKIPSIDEIMHDPENATIPEGQHLDRLFAISVMCSNYMNAENYEQLYKYVSRLPRDFEFAVHTDASYRDNSIIDDSLGFLKWIKDNKDLIA